MRKRWINETEEQMASQLFIGPATALVARYLSVCGRVFVSVPLIITSICIRDDRRGGVAPSTPHL